MEHGNEKRNSLKASVQLISKEDPANKSGSLNYDINRDLDNTALTNSNKKKSRRLCGSAKKNEDTLKNNRNSAKNEEIQLNAINNNDNNKLVATAASAAVAENVTNKNQVKINLASIYDERQRQKPEKRSEVKKINCKSNKSNSGDDSSSDEEKVNRCKIVCKTIKRILPCLVAWTLLVGSSGVYFAFVATELVSILKDLIYWIVLMNFQCILFLFLIVNFLIAILRDPGRFEKIVISPDDPDFSDDTKSPLYKTIKIQKAAVKIKWCSVSVFVFVE
jgi:hypothetical protein